MARSRNIKPSIMDNDQLAELDPLTRLLFVYMWMLADKAGRLEDRPKRIAAQALPFDRSCDVDAMLASLHDAGFIRRYKADGLACIQIVNFSKHQTPHVRESESTLPAPDMESAKHNLGDVSALPRQCKGDDETSPRSPDSLIPDSLIPEKEAAPSGPAPLPAERKKPAVLLRTWLEQCRLAGEKAISDYEPIKVYVEKSSLPWEFVQLCWDEFRRRHMPGGGSEMKRQSDWRKTFLNCLQGNWYRLWWARAEGEYELTSSGLQAKTVNRVPEAA